MNPEVNWMGVICSILGLLMAGSCVWLASHGYGMVAAVVFVVTCVCIARLEG